MKKYLLFPLCAALCLLAGCADDFPTELNHNYYQDDTPPAEPDITEQTVKLGTYNLWISNKGTGDYVWTHRRDILAQSIVNNDWDIFGFQEAQQYDPERTADAGGGQGRQLRMVVRRPRFAGRQERRGAGHRLRSRPVRTERPALFLALTDARRDELRLGRGELPPHRLLRRGDGQGLRQAVFHDGDAHAAGRHGAFGGREGHHRARADVQHAGDALGAGRRHECHAGRRRFGDVPHPLGGRLSGDGSGVRRRSRRHVQRAQDLDRPFGLDGPHRLHLHARSAVAENL